MLDYPSNTINTEQRLDLQYYCHVSVAGENSLSSLTRSCVSRFTFKRLFLNPVQIQSQSWEARFSEKKPKTNSAISKNEKKP